MADPIFVDTGALIAIKLKDDPYHLQAVEFMRKLGRRPRFTSSLVLAEAYTWLRYHFGLVVAATMVEEILEGELLGLYTLVRPRRQEEEESLRIGRKFADVKLSWTDAMTFAIVRGAGIKEIFGFDEHLRLSGCLPVPN